MRMPEQIDASKTSCFEEPEAAASSPVNAKLVVMKESCFDVINGSYKAD